MQKGNIVNFACIIFLYLSCASVSSQDIYRKRYTTEILNDSSLRPYILVMRFTYEDKSGFLMEESDIVQNIFRNKRNISKNKIQKIILKNQSIRLDSTLFKLFKHSIILDDELIIFKESVDEIKKKYFLSDGRPIKCNDRALDLSLVVFLFKNNIFIHMNDESGDFIIGKREW